MQSLVPQLCFCLWNPESARRWNNEPFYQKAADRSLCKQAVSTGNSSGRSVTHWRECRKRSKTNERPLSSTVHTPNQLKLLQHIRCDGLAEKKPLFLRNGRKLRNHIFFGRLERYKDGMQWWEMSESSSEYGSSHGVTPEFFYLSHIKAAKSLWNISGEEITQLSGFQRMTYFSRGRLFWTHSGQ